MDKAKDLDVGQAYQNDKAGRAVVRHIAKVEQDRTVNVIDVTSFFSLTLDGATDVFGLCRVCVHTLCTYSDQTTEMFTCCQP